MISSQMRSATYRHKRSFSGISVWIALMLLAFVAHANDDEVIKKLIGRWEEQVLLRPNQRNERL